MSIFDDPLLRMQLTNDTAVPMLQDETLTDNLLAVLHSGKNLGTAPPKSITENVPSDVSSALNTQLDFGQSASRATKRSEGFKKMDSRIGRTMDHPPPITVEDESARNLVPQTATTFQGFQSTQSPEPSRSPFSGTLRTKKNSVVHQPSKALEQPTLVTDEDREKYKKHV